MGSFATLTAADGFAFPAYVAQPAGAPKGAVVVVQEIFGVNAHIRAVEERAWLDICAVYRLEVARRAAARQRRRSRGRPGDDSVGSSSAPRIGAVSRAPASRRVGSSGCAGAPATWLSDPAVSATSTIGASASRSLARRICASISARSPARSS